MRFLFVFMLLFCNNSFNASALDFQKISVEKALVKAQKENKKVLIYFTAGWCLPCKIMSKTVFPNDTIVKIIKDNFIAIKLDMDSWKSSPYKKEFNIVGIPNFLILNGDRKLINRALGGQNVKEFINFLLTENIHSDKKYTVVGEKKYAFKSAKWNKRPGLNLAVNQANITNFNHALRTGGSLGLFASFDKDRFMIKPSVNFLSGGVKNQKLNYLQFPVDFGFTFIKHTVFGNQGGFKVIGGPYYSFLLNGNAGKQDYGLSYGIGMFMGSDPQSSIDLIFRIDRGFNDIYPQVLANQRNQIYSLSATLTFGK